MGRDVWQNGNDFCCGFVGSHENGGVAYDELANERRTIESHHWRLMTALFSPLMKLITGLDSEEEEQSVKNVL